ncbi:TPA: hypothetical protein NJY08_005049 [Salmonella enterica subsp. enterica serovar Typhi str. AG3]|nr:hypothetical protein [Salmonella enterica subsp. enterica serovar Typhi str. AG3]
MEVKKFKVVGVQVMPKKAYGKHQFIQQFADGEVKHSYNLFEKLVRPVNKEFVEKLRYEDSKNKSTRQFSVVALVNYRKGQETHGSILFNPHPNVSMNVYDELTALVQTVN